MSHSGRAALWTGRRFAAIVLVTLVTLATAACSGADRSGPTAPTPTPSVRLTVSGSTAPGVGPLVSVTDTSAVVPAFPAVVSLGWLDGPSAAPAIRVQADGLVRWQGSTPGEAAQLLPTGAYRWVGPDGSMVGCAPSPKDGHAACVGVDPAGNTAITGPSGVRVVYGPGGGWIGDFQSDGSRSPGARPSRNLAQALSDTGVDFAALLDFATRQPPFAGGITGDPHLITTGGVRVTSQQLGDFEARVGDPAHQIQIRTEAMPYRTDVAEVTAVVVGASGHRIEFRSSGDLFVDGDQITGDGKFRQITLPNGVVVGWWLPDADDVVDAVVLWPDGSAVSMAADSALGMTVVAHLPSVAVGGLFGTEQTGASAAPVTPTPTPNIPDAPTAPRGDFAGRAASSTAQATGANEAIVQSWRIRPGESMFLDPAPAPVPRAPAPTVSATASLAAEKYCAAADLIDPGDVAGCVFDVARTGDAGYVVHHAELAASAEKPAFPPAISAGWPALELGSVDAPVGLGPDAQVDLAVPAGGRRVYLIDLPAAAVLTIRATPCSGGRNGDEAASGAAALRLFDGSGHAVSARRSNCGRGQTGVLAAGSYYLVLAGPNAGSAAPFKLRVSAG